VHPTHAATKTDALPTVWVDAKGSPRSPSSASSATRSAALRDQISLRRSDPMSHARWMQTQQPQAAASTCAGHTGMLTGGYALFVVWWCAVKGDSSSQLGPLSVRMAHKAEMLVQSAEMPRYPAELPRVDMKKWEPLLASRAGLPREDMKKWETLLASRAGVPSLQLIWPSARPWEPSNATHDYAFLGNITYDLRLESAKHREQPRSYNHAFSQIEEARLRAWRAANGIANHSFADVGLAGRFAALRPPNASQSLSSPEHVPALAVVLPPPMLNLSRSGALARLAPPNATKPLDLRSQPLPLSNSSVRLNAVGDKAALPKVRAASSPESLRNSSALVSRSSIGAGVTVPPRVSQAVASAPAVASASTKKPALLLVEPPLLPLANSSLRANGMIVLPTQKREKKFRLKPPKTPAVAPPSVAPRVEEAHAPASPPSPVPPRRLHRQLTPYDTVGHLAVRAWGEVLLLGSVAVAILWRSDRGKSFEFSVPYLICYNIVCLRVPDLLGHVVISMMGSAHLYTSAAFATTAISFAYMGAMQAYLAVLRWVCLNMSSPHLFSRFHFVAQMYYYLFWYMMLMVVSPSGITEMNFWVMVAILNGQYLVSNSGVLNTFFSALRFQSPGPDPPLKVLFDSKLAVQDQLADVVSLLIVPAVATAFHVCAAITVARFPSGALLSLWQRFGALLVARLASGMLTEEIFRRRVDLLNKAEAMELQLLPSIDSSPHRARYLNDLSLGPNLAFESMRNIERCELYFAAVAVSCAFAVFQRGDVPARYAFVAFG